MARPMNGWGGTLHNLCYIKLPRGCSPDDAPGHQNRLNISHYPCRSSCMRTYSYVSQFFLVQVYVLIVQSAFLLDVFCVLYIILFTYEILPFLDTSSHTSCFPFSILAGFIISQVPGTRHISMVASCVFAVSFIVQDEYLYSVLIVHIYHSGERGEKSCYVTPDQSTAINRREREQKSGDNK